MSIKGIASIILVISLSLLTISCRDEPNHRMNKLNIQPNMTINQNNKPIVMILIDSLMNKSLNSAIQEGRVPAMQFLLDHGHYYPNVVSSFPTMSVTIDSTLLTGVYADKHHVPGLVWYNGDENRMIYYGNGFKEALKIDQLQVFMDSIYQLNHVQLNEKVKTIHEELAEQGKDSASINAVMFRGNTKHTLKVPQSIAKSTRLPEQVKITGPKWLSYAALKQLDPNNGRNTYLWKKYGMNDDFSAQDINFLIKEGKLPDFTIAYFPENDTYVHRKGPSGLKGIERADQSLQDVLNTYDSWEQALNSVIWIIMGDSGQSYVYDDKEKFIVDLRQPLNKYRIAELNQAVRNEDQIVISANERMAYIDIIDSDTPLSDIVNILQNEDKLDIIATKDDKNVHVTSGKSDNIFTYRAGGNYVDEYGQPWTISGDPHLMNISITKNRIKYGNYPDVLARLYGAMHSHKGRFIVVTVQPGYELVGESSPTHVGGGAHGSLHELDSLVPLIVSGTNSRPKTLRIVDIKNWILQLTNE